MSLVEAAAAGRAIVTTDVPGCRDVVRDEDNGLLIPPRNGHALATAIEKLLADPARRASDAEQQRRLEAALAELPDNQRSAILLCQLQGFSNVQAAQILGVKVRALESLLARARRALRTELTDHGEI